MYDSYFSPKLDLFLCTINGDVGMPTHGSKTYEPIHTYYSYVRKGQTLYFAR